jgi:hypothetical protein
MARFLEFMQNWNLLILAKFLLGISVVVGFFSFSQWNIYRRNTSKSKRGVCGTQSENQPRGVKIFYSY